VIHPIRQTWTARAGLLRITRHLSTDETPLEDGSENHGRRLPLSFGESEMKEPSSSTSGLGQPNDADQMDPLADRPVGCTGPRCLVVMYHYVHDVEPFAGLGLSSSADGVRGLTSREFALQVDQLCRSMEPIDWPALYAWMCGRGSIPGRSFLLTFDDGLADHARTVLPILQRRDLRGVFFVTGAELVSQAMLPAHAIHLLLSVLGDDGLEHELVTELNRQGMDGVAVVSSIDARAAQARYDYETPTRARLKFLLTSALPIAVCSAAVGSLFERHIGSSARWAKAWYLGWEELGELHRLGHTIGAHGYSHQPLTRLAPTERRQDLRRILAVLKSGLGSDIRPLSYPFGQWDDDVREACRELGIAHAFTTQPRWITRDDDVLTLPRVDTIKVNAFLKEELEWSQA